MLLKQVKVENFGPFRGVHFLDLTPSYVEGSLRPIVLIGGRNGSGKTSLLEAIRLCLYGRRALGNPRTIDYYDHLRNRLHKGASGKLAPSSSVCIEIEVVENGFKHTYEVCRSWGDVAEELRIKRNGEDLHELFIDQYQAFLDELMPLGLAEFFFFDGERIQRLAEDDGSDHVVADSVRSLLGLQVTSQLRADIAILMRSRSTARPTGEIQREIEEARLRLKAAERRIETLDAENQAAEFRNSSLLRAVKLQEQKIASEGGDFARKREGRLKDRLHWQASLRSCETELRELANDLLPFCLVPELCEEVRLRVEKEAAARQEEGATALVHAKLQEILRVLDYPAYWIETIGGEPTEEVHGLVKQGISGLVKRFENEASEPKPPLLHDLSERDQRTLFAAIKAVLTDVPRKIASLVATAEEARRRLSRVELDLQRAPSEEALKPLLAELSQLQTKLGEERQKQIQLETELHRASAEHKEIERTLKRLREQLSSVNQESKVMTLAASVRNVIKLYELELTVARVDHLADCISECHKQLAHKKSLCSQVRIDPKTLAVTLYNAQGDIVHRPLLSAGEKQILAIAILWGLGRASGRQLPIIIDTPLARLDVGHRDRLLSRYFPEAGPQVILLSTDSEISREGLNILHPSVAKTYHLRFDSEHNQTTIEAGYFPLSQASQ